MRMGSTEDQRRRTTQEYLANPIEVNRQIVAEFRSNGGRVPRLGGTSGLLLLTTRGGRSGQVRTTPMMYATEGDRYVVYASDAGARHHPGWYHNLVAHPEVSVEVGTERFAATAVITTGDERERLWRLFPFPEHEQKAQRQIPVIALDRRGP